MSLPRTRPVPEDPGPTDARPPIRIDRVLGDGFDFRGLVERNAPYAPVQRYFANAAEARSQSSQTSAEGPLVIAPNFRGDWAYERPLVDGAEVFLEHEGFRAAAAELFGSERVRPFAVYANLTWQLPFPQGGGHTDVPEFRGVNRSDHPTWLLNAMGHSRLFEPERVNIATAVAWFYTGRDGGFDYWPEGPDGPRVKHEGDIHDTAIVGDNDRMFHRVRAVGDRAKGLPQGMSLDSRLEHLGGDRWCVRDGDTTLGELAWPELRISVSWKAIVFADEAEERAYDEHTSDLAFDDVLDRFEADLDARGIAMPRPAEPSQDEAFVDLISSAYVCEPGAAQA
jgi:hypothetical protein